MAAEYPTVTGDNYVVVARRYRPKGFEELVGQDTVAQALAMAIRSGRVGHAYLFTGARGVGKTSTARIFAKALNAPGGPTPTPDLESDVAQAIDAGEDMDVIEIDGASNRGIDEIRQLRSNVNVRPSRSRYKIYIIDEVHMLTTQAFNALLKTLEEPPEHVKFIFCTTDPEKIPITVLSRCQRFDFPPVRTEAILERLKFICQNEGKTAEPAALQVIARRAAGSMRDSQSLLEQILSFAGDKLTLQSVHEVLGTADEELLFGITDCLLRRDATAVLTLLDSATSHGVDAGQLGEQVLGYLRDVMLACVGGSVDLIRTANPSSFEQLESVGKQWGLMTLLSAIQLLDEALVKMRYSVQSRILLEVALVQICQLHDLTRITELIAALDSSVTPKPISPAPRAAEPVKPAVVDEKKNVAANETLAITNAEKIPAPTTDQEYSQDGSADQGLPDQLAADDVSSVQAVEQSLLVPPSADSPTDLLSPDQANLAETSEPAVQEHISEVAPSPETSVSDNAVQTEQSPALNANDAWQQSLEKVEGMLKDYAALALRAVEAKANEWQIVFPMGSDAIANIVSSPEHRQKLVSAIKSTTGQHVQLTFVRSQEPPRTDASQESAPTEQSQSQRKREAAEHPLIRRIIDTLDGEIVRIDRASTSPPRPHMADPKPVRSPS